MRSPDPTHRPNTPTTPDNLLAPSEQTPAGYAISTPASAASGLGAGADANRSMSTAGKVDVTAARTVHARAATGSGKTARVISTAGKAATSVGAALSDPTTGNTTVGMCPRMLWRSMNPALPPPEPLTCLARGPDCCVNTAAAHVRRVA